MYRCSLCQHVVPPHTPALKIALETRPRTYPFRPEANRQPAKHPGRARRAAHHHTDRYSPVTGKKWDPRDDQGGRGYEIAREATVCPACYAGADPCPVVIGADPIPMLKPRRRD